MLRVQMPEPLWGLCAVPHGDKYVLLVGGHRNTGEQSRIFKFNAKQHGIEEDLAVMETPRFYHHTFLFENRLLVIGGNRNRTAEALDLGTKEWEHLSYLPREQKIKDYCSTITFNF